MNESTSLVWGVAGAGPLDETAALIDRCLAGEQAAYVALYDQYSGVIYRLAYSLLQQQQDAEEVLQDSFEYAFRRLDHFDPRKSAFKTWLYRIAVSRCHNKRRRKWLPSLSLHLLDGAEARDPTAPLPDERAALNEQQRAVWAAVVEPVSYTHLDVYKRQLQPRRVRGAHVAAGQRRDAGPAAAGGPGGGRRAV